MVEVDLTKSIGPTMDLILYAIPCFFILILLEFAYGMAKNNNTYRINDTINSLSMGSLSRLQGLVVVGLSGSVYELVAVHFQLSQLPDNEAWVWIFCFVLYDLAYYWKHRFGHEIALFWGSHVSHHQSEDFNLGTALRQTSIDFHSFLFYLPFFVFGFPAEILFTVVSLNLIYQFWVHTEHLPKLGLLESVFVTPSNHRVHHARNKIYVDKNYGGVFIIWDRLFGSFQDELADEKIIFGLRKPLNSWNPVWANFHVYWSLLIDLIKMSGWKNKLKLCFMRPGWQPQGQDSSCKLKHQEIDLTSQFDPKISAFTKYYTFIQFVITIILSLYLLLNANAIIFAIKLGLVLFLAYSLCVHGFCMEARTTAIQYERIRLILLIVLIQLIGLSLPIISALVLVALASLVVIALPAFKTSSYQNAI